MKFPSTDLLLGWARSENILAEMDRDTAPTKQKKLCLQKSTFAKLQAKTFKGKQEVDIRLMFFGLNCYIMKLLTVYKFCRVKFEKWTSKTVMPETSEIISSFWNMAKKLTFWKPLILLIF